MEKIFTYKEPETLYNKEKLRLIVYNILEILPEFDRINCNILFNNEYEYMSTQYYADDFLYNKITIGFDPRIEQLCEEIVTTSVAVGFYSYLETLGITGIEKNIALFIFCMLHELGHSIIQRYIPGYTDYKILKSIDKAYRNILNEMMDKTRPEDVDINSGISYAFSPIELHATLYAYRYFQYVWNILKQRGLI